MRPSHESPHRSPRRLSSALAGGVLFAAVLALSLPGVRAVQAQEAGAVEDFLPAPIAGTGAVDAPMCRAAAAPAATAASIEQMARALRAQAGGPDAAGDGPVNLNTRGYNYGAPSVGSDAAVALLERRLEGRAGR